MFNSTPAIFRHLRILIRKWRYPGSIRYWEHRYAHGGHSGSGSSGRLAAYKADWLNSFIRKKNIRSVVEFGCGDGRQLQLLEYPEYLGLDVAPSAVRRCRELFAGDQTKSFQVYDPFNFDPESTRAELGLSLEVLFHLTEDEVYHLYLKHLFATARQWVVVFAPDEPDRSNGQFPHVRLRQFTQDIPDGWQLHSREINPHRDISMSDFFVFEKMLRE